MNFNAFVRLTRLEHAVMLCAAVLIGEVVVLGQLPAPLYALLTFFPPFFLEVSAFSINDYFDVETDKLNGRTDRPLVTGEAKPSEALLIAAASFLIGIAAAWLINTNCFLVALAFGILSFAYSYGLKDVVLVGNLYVAITMAIPFIFGNFAVSKLLNNSIYLLVAIALVTGLGREVIGVVRDMEGDQKARGARTLPMVLGKQISLFFASLLFLLAVFLSIVPFLAPGPFQSNMNYAIPIVITDILLLYVVLRVMFDSQEFLSQARLITLAALAIGLIGFLLGAIT